MRSPSTCSMPVALPTDAGPGPLIDLQVPADASGVLYAKYKEGVIGATTVTG